MSQSQLDVIILGAGIAGLSLALALAKQGFRIAIVDRAPIMSVPPTNPSLRVFAITKANCNAWQSLAVWDTICDLREPSPLRQIHVSDAATQARIQFDSQAIGVPTMGYLLEQEVLLFALQQALMAFSENVDYHVIVPERVSIDAKHATVLLSDGKTLSASVVVGADGAKSWLREHLRFALTQHKYNQMAIVAQITTQKAHAATARQVFLDDEILAFLPLADSHQCSIVWSVNEEHAKVLMALDDEIFLQKLSAAFGNTLGDLSATSQRLTFPLIRQQVSQYIQPRVALVGDAAHTIHPLAGQGLNMGLQDVWRLVDVLITAKQKQRDIGAYDTLRRYERWRKTHNVMMAASIDALKQGFALQNPLIQQARALGMRAIDTLNCCKDPIVRYAMGLD